MVTNVELNIMVQQLKKDLDREVEKRAKDIKYMENMVEDVQSRYADISLKINSIEGSVRQHFTEDAKMSKSIEGIGTRLLQIERMTWVGFGGLAVLWGAITILPAFLK